MQLNDNPDFILYEEYSAAEQRNYTGSFCGFVLLNSNEYDLSALQQRLQRQWNIVPDIASNITLDIAPSVTSMKTTGADLFAESVFAETDLLLDIPGAMITISFVDEPVPEEEAERFAANNTDWKEAISVVKTHTAHLMVAVLPGDMQPVEAGRLYSKVISSCLDDSGAVAVYTSGTVLEPEQFQRTTTQMGDTLLPLDNLIYIGVYSNETGNNGYTIGMDAFGKDELEILGSTASMETVRFALKELAAAILKQDIAAQWYIAMEAAGYHWEGRRKDGVMVEGHSVQFDMVSQ